MKKLVFLIFIAFSLEGFGEESIDYGEIEEQATSAYYNGSHTLALDLLEETIRHYQEEGDEHNVIRINIFIAEIHRSARSFSMGLSTLAETELKIKNKENNPFYAHLLNRKAAIQFEQKIGRVCCKNARRSMAIEKSLGTSKHLSSNLSIIGAWLRDNGKTDSSKYFLDLSLTLAKREEITDDIITGTLNKAWYFERIEDLDSAKIYSFKALKLCRIHKQRNRIYHAHSLLSDLYASEGDFEKGLIHHRAQIGIRDSIITEETQKKFDELAQGYQTRYRLTELRLLEQENENKSTLIAFLLSTVLLVGLFGVYVLRRNKYYKKLSAQLVLQRNELDNKKDELLELNTLKTKLFSVLAHDIRGPLTSVKGILDIMVDDNLSDDDRSAIVNKLSHQIDNTSSLLGSIITWSKTQLEGATIKKEDVDLAGVIRNEFGLMKSRAAEKGINIRIKPSCVCSIKTDAQIVGIIVRNLINNAIKFTRQGGDVIVECIGNAKGVSIVIEDSGIGMSKEKLHSLFSPKTENTLGTNKEQGFGLGLMLCYDFAEKLGATISVESEVGLGSTFTVTFPLS